MIRAPRKPLGAAGLLAAGLMVAGGAATGQVSGAAPMAETQAGHAVFTEWCAGCHSRGLGNPGTQSLEVKYAGRTPAALEDRTDLTPQLTTYFVRHGAALMPPFRKTEISDVELRQLAAYLAPEGHRRP